MAEKQYPIINNFSKGELSSRMEGRVDIQGYYNGCKIMRNCIMVAQGGAEKRPGTIYLGEVYNPGQGTEAKLIPFEVNDTEIYILEVGHHVTRVWDVQEKELIQDPNRRLLTYNGGTGLTPVLGEVITGSTSSAYGEIYRITSGSDGVSGSFILEIVTGGPFKDDEELTGSADFVAVADGAEIETDLILRTPYTSDDVSAIQYATTEGQIFFAHSGYPFQYIEKKDDEFVLTQMNYEIDLWEAKEYTKGQVTFYDGSYYKAIMDTGEDSPEVGEWSKLDGHIGATPSGDIEEWKGGDFSTDDIILYEGKIYQAKRNYSGDETCWPEIEIQEYAWVSGSEESEWVWHWDRRCITEKFWVCWNRLDYVDYIDEKYARDTVQVKNRWFISVGLGAWVYYTLVKKEITSSKDNDPYWGDSLTGVPGGTGTKEIKEFADDGEYDIDEVVYTDTYGMYKCLANGTTSAPGEVVEWELINNNPFFSVENDYPASVAFMDRRLYLGGTLHHPQTFYGSKIGQYNNFDKGIDDDDAFSFTIAAERSSRIKWMVGQDNLIVGTTSSEWLITGGDQGITPTNVRVLKQSAYGSAYNQAIFVADSLLFYQKGGRKLREYMYSNDNKAYLANDLSFFADHITSPGIDESSYQQNPDSILWNTKINGGLVGLTYDRLNQIAGWHRHDTEGEFESVVAIDGRGPEDELWFIIRRRVDGEYKRYVEYMAPRLNSSTTDMIFSDSASVFVSGKVFSLTAITYSITSIEVAYTGTEGIANGDSIKIYNTDSPLFDMQIFQVENLSQGEDTGTFDLQKNSETFIVTSFDTITDGNFSIVTDTITGLDHLIGKTVDIIGDNAYFPSQEVVEDVDGAGGVGVILATPCNRVICGLNYVMLLQPQSIELQGTLAAKRRISKVTLKLYNTLGGFVGSDLEHIEELRFRSTALPFGKPPGLFTGTKDITVDAPSEQEANIIIQHNQPLPMTVLAIITDISYSRS